MRRDIRFRDLARHRLEAVADRNREASRPDTKGIPKDEGRLSAPFVLIANPIGSRLSAPLRDHFSFAALRSSSALSVFSHEKAVALWVLPAASV